MRHQRVKLGTLALLALAGCGGSSAPVELPLSGTWSGELTLEANARKDFVLKLPEDTVIARVTLLSDVPEVDLHAHPSERVLDLDDAQYMLDDLEGPPQLTLNSLGPDPVGGTDWHLAVHWPYLERPRIGDRRQDAAAISLEVEVHRARVDAELAPGVPVRSWLDDESGGFRSFRLIVPPDAKALRIDLSDVESDLDIYARAGGPVLDFVPEVAFAEHSWGRETLLLDAQSEPPLVSGEWRIDVQDALGPNRRLPFTIHASFDADVPAALLEIPRSVPTPGETPVQRAARAVVEITTKEAMGSGTLLSRDGWILTNAHVLGNDMDAEIVVSLLVDAARPAVECFRAQAVELDVARDLALIQITGGLFDQPLPDGYELPTLEIGEPAALGLGAPLWLVGYPATGGTGSRVTITATRGIVSGFERADFGRLIKTDAEITRGNSGGAAIDERGLLIGVPSSTVENGSGQIGYVHPIDALPPSWRARIAR